ncbi:MAG TPA: 3-oxoadipate enol-lactonase [Anaeromyxobacter sp.]
MPFTDLGGVRLHHVLEGRAGGPVLVLSHSLGTDHRLWDPQLPALAGRFRVLRYDLRGHGASSVSPAPFDVAALGRDVLSLLDRLGAAQFSFCGLSLGGMIGMWLGVNAPGRIRRLVLANTSARLAPPGGWDARIAAVEKGGMIAVAGAVLERWFTPGFRAERPAEVERIRAMLLATPPAGYAGACAAIRDMDQRSTLPAIRAPVLVVAGSADPATPPADGRFLAQAIPGARYVELPAAHLSNVEAAEPFTRAVTRFLSEGEPT